MVEAAAMVAVRPRFPVAHAAVAAATIEGYLRFLGGPFAGAEAPQYAPKPPPDARVSHLCTVPNIP
jgi:hypothetical protein